MDSKSHKKSTSAKRIDRFMSWLVSAGGALIIAAVLGMMVFIAMEALPLFRGAKIKELDSGGAMTGDVAFLHESGKCAATFGLSDGFRVRTLGQEAQLEQQEWTHDASAPALPWKSAHLANASGLVVVQGRDGRIYTAEVHWEKVEEHISARIEWSAPYHALPGDNLIAARPTRGRGPMGRRSLKIAVLDSDSIRFANAQPESQIEWERWALPPSTSPLAAEWSADGSMLYVGTKEGELRVFSSDHELPPSNFGEPITALGFALGHNSLLVGGADGKLAAYQVVLREGEAKLQCFHTFKPLEGKVMGFMASLRDKRFLAWSDRGFSVNHLTTEKTLARRDAEIVGAAALSPRGDHIFASSSTSARQWQLDAFHPEVSWSLFWRKIHYEGYTAPEYVWQSGGATDDIEPKFSLVPLLFGTIKGTFYAMLFALPIAVLSALYASQFASPRLRGAIKPTVEIMAGLPSVVLGFIAGLVLAPLLENWMMAVLMVIPVAFVLTFLLMLAWIRLPKPFRDRFGNGQEAMWLIPVIILSLAVSSWIAPMAENLFFGGDYRNWLYQGHGLLYDQRNSIVVGFAMGFAVIPIIFSISEDAFSAVPKSLSSASLACGASPWQTAWRVVLPTASPGIFSAVMVGLGRAIGETMIVLMATGNTPLMDWGPFNGMRTLSANIAVEIPEAPHQGTLYRILFFTALLLFALTFLLNTAAELIRQSLRKRYESM